MISLTEKNKQELIDKLMDKTIDSTLRWDKIGHHRLSPPSIERYIQSRDDILVFSDSYWTSHESGYFFILHFIYASKTGNSSEYENLITTLQGTHGIFEIPKDLSFFDNRSESYAIVVQSSENVFPEVIPPAGNPMNAEMKALCDLIKKTLHLNSDFLDSFLSN